MTRHRSIVFRVAVSTAALAAALAVALPAQAAPGGQGVGRALGLARVVGTGSIHAPAPSGRPYFAGAPGAEPLGYYNGPVETNIMVYALAWNPSNNPSPNNASDQHWSAQVATATNALAQWTGEGLSGAQTGVDDARTQYCGVNGCPGVGVGFAVNTTVTDPSPNDCTVAGFTGCSTNGGIVHLVEYERNIHGWPDSWGTVYVVYAGSQESVCTSTANCFAGPGGFCGYHSYYTIVDKGVLTYIPFVVVPYSPDVNKLTPGGTCDYVQAGATNGLSNVYPQGAETVVPPANAPANDLVNVQSHEINELMTDPEGNAWFANNGNEMADNCNFQFGPLSGFASHTYAAGGAQWNNTNLGLFSGHPYFMLQGEWSNAEQQCVLFGT